MSAAVGRLEGHKRDAVELHDLEGQTFAQVGKILGVSRERVNQFRKKALHDLYRDRQLRRALDEETLYYQRWGVNAFNTTFTSVTERVAMWRIELQERAARARQGDKSAESLTI